ncbi:hypothetical protein I308_100829 [Cryptococcus tetragattii IND107]|uniref:Uncharacterized protein n=1 Tax=Cryptococcus tetragattii IND107 TaxID=1296105 RepID=A0ABR3C5W6_9TREE
MTADTDVHSSMPKNMDTSKSAPKPSLLFADDYSLSSPASSTKSETPNSSALPTPLSLPASRESAKNLDPLATHRLPQHLPLASPNNETLLTPLMSRHHQDYFGNTSPGTATAERHDLSPHTASSGSRSGSTSGSGVKSVLAKIQASFPEQQRRYNLSSHPLHPSQPSQYFDAPVPVPANSRKGKGYNTYESCMEGALGHDIKASTYQIGTERAYHHLNRSNELFIIALTFRLSDKKAMLGRSRVPVQLAINYHPPHVAIASLREAVSTLRSLTHLAPQSLTARETLAQACSLLSSTLHEIEDYIEDENAVWNGEIGELAREALQNWEEVAAERMDRIRAMRNIANLVARVQLASGESSLERLRHTFALGVELDEEDFRVLLQDMALLSDECRQRAAKLKGRKGSVASTLAWESLKQLDDAKTIYANMLRWVWRKRKPRRKGHTRNESPASFGLHSRNHGTRENVDQTIKEEGEGENSISRRESNSLSNGSDGLDAAHRKGSSALTAVSEGVELSFAIRPPYRSSVTSIPTPGRRSSWLPSPTDMAAVRARRKSSLASPRSQSFASHDGGHEGLPALHHPRRISSTGSLTLPNGISAWNRKPSVMSIPSDDVAPQSREQASAKAEEFAERKAKWGYRKRLARDVRQKRKEFW